MSLTVAFVFLLVTACSSFLGAYIGVALWRESERPRPLWPEGADDWIGGPEEF